ncbi:MAG: AraC family transcriptional regulator, partial [Sphaerochaeta sp.]
CEITESRDDKLVNLYYSTTQMIKETIRCYLACHITSLDMHHLAITFCLTKEQALHAATIISQVLEKTVQVIYNYFSVKLVCCVGTKVEDAFSLSDSFFAARQLMEQATADHPILFYDRQIIQTQNQTFNLADFREQLTKAFEELDALALKKVLNDVANSLETQEASRLQGIEAASNILYMAITLLPDGQQLVEQVFQDEQLGYRKIYKMNNVNQCAVWLRTLGNGLEELLLTRRQDYRAKVIANIQQYIKDNLGRKLQLGEVALLFGFSQNYLSSLFSKYGGCSFVEYTTNAKIQAAKDMMASGDYKMYEISDKLGFENAFYFSKVFKKVEGKSPREYLHQLSRKRN